MNNINALLSLSAAGLLLATPASGDSFKPEVIQWGASAAELEAALEGKCADGFVTRPIDPPFLPKVQDRQVQIDCDGFDFLGAPRWAEFVIGDDRLQVVWIMIETQDQAAVLAALTEAYGPPSGKNDDYVAFTQARAAWRSEPPEVLFYAPLLDAWVLPWFEVATGD